MSGKTETLREHIRMIMPDLEIERFEVNDEGLINDVVIINEKYVFRFPKSEGCSRILDVELRILDLVRSRVGVEVPTPIHRDERCVVYPFLVGTPLLREEYLELPDSNQEVIARSLGRFLHRLHTTEVSGLEQELPATLAPVTRERWLDIYEGVKEKVYPLLWKHQVVWAERVFDSMLATPGAFDFTPALIHGDLRPYHVLMDGKRGEISGIIDFGVAGIGDPALDIGTLINTYGESFVIRMKEAYPGLKECLVRARFYAQSLELHWVLLGIETGDTFWFAAHLGCARDISV